MSFFKDQQTEFEDQACLMGALDDAGLTGKYTVHETKQKLQGYGTGYAEIVLHRHTFGNSYEAGFSKQADGKFKFIQADDDNLDLKLIRRAYGERRSMNLAKSKGMKLLRREEIKTKDGQFQTKLIFQPAANA